MITETDTTTTDRTRPRTPAPTRRAGAREVPKASLARLAGLLYLIVGICGGWAELFVRAGLRVPGDAAATAANVAANAGLVRLGFAADLVNIACFLGVALLMHAVLAPVNRRVAFAMVAFNAVSVAIMGLNSLNHIGALLVATDPSYAAGFGPGATDALVALLLDLHAHGFRIAQVFFGLWLLPLGWLVYRSGFVPRLLGVLLVIGCGGYLADLVAVYLSPGFETDLTPYLAMPSGLAEVLFLLWLLIVGVRTPRRGAPTPAAA